MYVLELWPILGVCHACSHHIHRKLPMRLKGRGKAWHQVRGRMIENVVRVRDQMEAIGKSPGEEVRIDKAVPQIRRVGPEVGIFGAVLRKKIRGFVGKDEFEAHIVVVIDFLKSLLKGVWS